MKKVYVQNRCFPIILSTKVLFIIDKHKISQYNLTIINRGMINMVVKSSEYVSTQYLELNSCGIQRLWNTDCGSTREHGRSDFHILYLGQGCCYAEINGEETIINEGDIVLFLPGEKQKYYFLAKDKSTSYYIHFSGTGCMELLKNCGFLPNHVISPGKNPVLEEVFRKMRNEKYLGKPMYKKMSDTYLMQFFIELCRIMQKKNKVLKSGTDMDKICLKMIEECTEKNDVSYYADLCHLSTSRFHHVFKAHTGVSPIEYINNAKINRAKELLSNTNLSVADIAERIGFSDQNYFCRMFKKKTGITPKQFSMKY